MSRRAFFGGSILVAAGYAGCLETDDGPDPRGDYQDAPFLASEPDYGEWFESVSAYERTIDLTAEESVRVAVGAGGGLSFLPAAIAIQPGTRVVWEWTGRGGEHNVVATGGEFRSQLINEAGHRFDFEFDFDSSGVHRYTCTPHDHVGMRGAVTVVD